jgi:hypothetical protein
MEIIKKPLLLMLFAAVLLWSGQIMAEDDGDDLTYLFSEDESEETAAPSAEQGAALPSLPPSMVTLPPPVPATDTLEEGSPFSVSNDEQTPPDAAPLNETDEGIEPFQGQPLTAQPQINQPQDSAAAADEGPAGLPSPIELPVDPVQAQENQPAPLPAESTSDYRVSGQVLTPPPLPWQSESRETTGAPSQSGPLPDFDTSQGRWQQMEVGQFSRPRNSVPGQAAPLNNDLSGTTPLSSEQSGDGSNQAASSAESGQTAAPANLPPGRSETMRLFQDLVPELSTPDPSLVDPATAGPLTVPLPPPPMVTSSDNALPEPASAPPASPVSPLGDQTPDFSEPPATAGSIASIPSVMDPTESQEQLDDDNLAISRAGSVLVEKGLNPKVGSASILDPTISPTPQRPAKSSNTSSSAKSSSGQSADKQASAKPKSESSSSQETAPRSQTRVVRPNLTVIVVNETGNPQVGQSYREVLSQMGYSVLGVTDRPPTGNTGQTIVTYQANRRSQASTLARHLPGQRHLVPSRDALPAEAIVTIR